MKQKLLKILYRFLAYCARIYISRNKIQVIAITGSVGKTSCRMVVSEVLEQIHISQKHTPHPNLLLKEKEQVANKILSATSSSPSGEEL